ncbi:MAG: F0F1 ATP synthase subunit alpha, partial [Verrucomicrobiota bacterium]
LERGKRIVELFKQIQYNPIPVEIQASILWSMQNNFLDNVPVEKVKDFQAKLTDFLSTRKAALLDKVRVEKAIGDALAGELKAAITEFKASYR